MNMTLKIHRALAIAMLLTVPTAFAGTNTVSGNLKSYYVNPPAADVGGIAAADPVARGWSVPYATASARAGQGTNRVDFAWTPPANVVLDPYVQFVTVQSRWTDTLVITGGSGTNLAVLRLRIQGHRNGDRSFSMDWQFDMGPGVVHIGEPFPVGDSPTFRYVDFPFVYGVPFTVGGQIYGSVGVNQAPVSGSS